jgi:tetratricopeptide (TPR) repeat protein
MLEQATYLDPALERAWFNLGKALALLGRGKEADAAFEKCFERSPEKRLMALAAEHHKEGRTEEAERLYRRVLRDNPRNVDALRLLAQLAVKANRATTRRCCWSGRSRSPRTSCLRSSTSASCARRRTAMARRSSASTGRLRSSRQCPVTFLRAATLARASFTQEAVEAYRRCLAARPNISARCSGSATS